MAAIVWADLTAYVPGLSTVNITVQTDLLTYVNGALDVSLFRLGENDPRLRLARIFLALHYATSEAANAGGNGTAGPVGPVTGRAMDGVSVSYANLAAPGTAGSAAVLFSETYWGRRYLEIMRPIRSGFLIV